MELSPLLELESDESSSVLGLLAGLTASAASAPSSLSEEEEEMGELTGAMVMMPIDFCGEPCLAALLDNRDCLALVGIEEGSVAGRFKFVL